MTVGQDNGQTPQAIASVTYNGVALSPKPFDYNASGGVQTWTLMNPASGTHAIVVTQNLTLNAAGTSSVTLPLPMAAIAISGAGVTGIVSKGGTYGANPSSFTVASDANGLVLDGTLNANPAQITGSRQTQRVSVGGMFGSTAAGTGSNVTMGYTASGSSAYWISVVEFTGSASGTGSHPKGRREILGSVNYVPGIGLLSL